MCIDSLVSYNKPLLQILFLRDIKSLSRPNRLPPKYQTVLHLGDIVVGDIDQPQCHMWLSSFSFVMFFFCFDTQSHMRCLLSSVRFQMLIESVIYRPHSLFSPNQNICHHKHRNPLWLSVLSLTTTVNPVSNNLSTLSCSGVTPPCPSDHSVSNAPDVIIIDLFLLLFNEDLRVSS